VVDHLQTIPDRINRAGGVDGRNLYLARGAQGTMEDESDFYSQELPNEEAENAVALEELYAMVGISTWS
jgi:hypothetical protein